MAHTHRLSFFVRIGFQPRLDPFRIFRDECADPGRRRRSRSSGLGLPDGSWRGGDAEFDLQLVQLQLRTRRAPQPDASGDRCPEPDAAVDSVPEPDASGDSVPEPDASGEDEGISFDFALPRPVALRPLRDSRRPQLGHD